MVKSMMFGRATMVMMAAGALVALTTITGCGNAAEQSQASGAAADTSNGPDSAGWCHDDLESTDSTNIDFDYKVVMRRDTTQGDPQELGSSPDSYLHASNPSFTGSEEVDVTVVDYRYEEGDGEPQYQWNATQVVHLAWDASSNRFTGKLPNALDTYRLIEGDDEFEMHRYEFATEVNGTWLTDPISGGHNFVFNPEHQMSGNCLGYYFIN